MNKTMPSFFCAFILQITSIVILFTQGVFAQGSNDNWSNGSFVVGMEGIPWVMSTKDSNLYIGGGFIRIFDDPEVVNHLLKYTNGTISNFGTGLNGTVRAIKISGNNVYVGGDFDTAGGIRTGCIAKWNGTAWSSLGQGIKGSVTSIAIRDTNIYVAGGFDSAGTVSANNIARWNGQSWSALGGGTNNIVNGLVFEDSILFVVGDFDTVGSGLRAKYIAKWNGSTWDSLGSGLNNTANVIVEANSGICVGGKFSTAGSTTVNHLALWKNGAWQKVGTTQNFGTNGQVMSLLSKSGLLYVGGSFDSAGSISANNIAVLNFSDSSWANLGSGTNGFVTSIAGYENTIWVGGSFFLAGEKQCAFNAEWTEPTSQSGSINSRNPRNSIDTIFPQPGRHLITIPFSVQENARVKIEIRDRLGNLIQDLTDQKYTTGTYHVQWDVESIPAGTYFCTFRTESSHQAKKIIVVK